MDSRGLGLRGVNPVANLEKVRENRSVVVQIGALQEVRSERSGGEGRGGGGSGWWRAEEEAATARRWILLSSARIVCYSSDHRGPMGLGAYNGGALALEGSAGTYELLIYC